MKKLFIVLALVSLAFGSCREQKTETKEVIREVEVEVEPETSDENEGILERAAKEVDKEVNEEIDLRTAPKAIKDNKIYNQEVLDMRWNLCSSCEFLTDGKKCQKCGCFMTVKHKLSQARCPIGKWGKYKEEAIHGIATTG